MEAVNDGEKIATGGLMEEEVEADVLKEISPLLYMREAW